LRRFGNARERASGFSAPSFTANSHSNLFRIITQIITPAFRFSKCGELIDEENAIYIPVAALPSPCARRTGQNARSLWLCENLHI